MSFVRFGKPAGRRFFFSLLPQSCPSFVFCRLMRDEQGGFLCPVTKLTVAGTRADFTATRKQRGILLPDSALEPFTAAEAEGEAFEIVPSALFSHVLWDCRRFCPLDTTPEELGHRSARGRPASSNQCRANFAPLPQNMARVERDDRLLRSGPGITGDPHTSCGRLFCAMCRSRAPPAPRRFFSSTF